MVARLGLLMRHTLMLLVVLPMGVSSLKVAVILMWLLPANDTHTGT